MNIRKLRTLALSLVILGLPLGVTAGGNSEQDRTSSRPDINQVVRIDQPIAQIAVEGGFTTLVAALTATDLVGTLSSPGNFTVFAPTDAAFAKLPPAILNYLLANPDLLKSVLLYHVVPGVKDLRFQFYTRDLATVNGQEVYAERERDTLFINNAVVQGKVIRANNGVIYVIDSVLLPQYR
jgi:uncharacterized surface protein with fasciclin (FAS1) repeats